jgi:23S rRNA-intervening sequence protein
MARSYRNLLVWQKAKALAVSIYRETVNFPKTETYGLTSQLRRAAVSVTSNIAEGQGRLTRGEFLNFRVRREVLCSRWMPSSPLLLTCVIFRQKYTRCSIKRSTKR